MTGENDERKFEEWWKAWKGADIKRRHHNIMLECWFASRRLLREEIDKQLEKEGWEDGSKIT